MASHSDESLASYDDIPYPSRPIRQTHPCRMATLPVLFGLEPAPPAQSRVLELGCAAGGNLLPMAQDLPDSEFLGVDLSARQIADGQSQLSRLPLTNVSLEHRSIADVNDDLGEFDYIICHGVYSWVPREIQDKILEIGRNQLSPRGVLYVSYNTQPGWRLRGAVRDMMRFHTEPFDDPKEKIAQARSLLKFLIDSADSSGEAYPTLLREEAKLLDKQSDAYLFHEHLEEVNEPIYFSEFVHRARRAGLSYLAEAEFPMMLSENFDKTAAGALASAPLLRQEQYMDFLRARTFRCTLLCHQESKIVRTVGPDRLSKLHISIAEPLDFAGVDLDSSETIERSILGGSVATSAPGTKRALAQLSSEYPASIPWEALHDQALRADKAAISLPADLMTMFGKGIVRAALDPPSFVVTPGDLPLATPLARDQAQHDTAVTNRLHGAVKLDVVAHWLLPHLDGSRTREDLSTLVESAVASGQFQVTNNKQPVDSITRESAQQIVEHALKTLGANALLIS